jgi:hypothetical protein
VKHETFFFPLNFLSYSLLTLTFSLKQTAAMKGVSPIRLVTPGGDHMRLVATCWSVCVLVTAKENGPASP